MRARIARAATGIVRCEFVEAFAKPYPSQTIARVMGAPIEDAPRLHHWSNWIQRQFDAARMASEREGIERAVEEFYEYAEALVEARREDPRGRSDLEADRRRGGAGERLSDVECINLVFNVLAGGVDTTQSQLAHAIGCWPNTPSSGRCCARTPSSRRRPSRRRCDTSRSRRSPRGSRPRR